MMRWKNGDAFALTLVGSLFWDPAAMGPSLAVSIDARVGPRCACVTS